MPRSCAAWVIFVASSSPRLRMAGSLLANEYGQNRNEQTPLMAMPISWAALRMAAYSAGPDLGDRSLSRS